MSSCEYFFIFSAFIVPSFIWCDLAHPLPEDEEVDKKYIALDDTLEVLKRMTNYNASGESWFVTPFGADPNDLQEIDMNPQKFLTTNCEDTEERVQFILHDSEESEGIEFNIHNLTKINFDSSKPVKILCHGWLVTGRGVMVGTISKAYLTRGGYNVIAVDWSSYSMDLLYHRSVQATKCVGRHIANMIDSFVEERKARYSDFHIIGHSLGAHVAGFAGNFTKEKIGRITGLDPALPGFQYFEGPEGRLDSSDADFVDVIHTCSGVLGMSVPIGHVDFFPNGGSPLQPGCLSSMVKMIKMCSHGRSQEYFTESINNGTAFTAISCEDWDHFKNHKCEEVYALMGEDVSRDARGVFYLRTNDQAPFGEGQMGVDY